MNDTESLKRCNDQLYLALKDVCEECKHRNCENSTSCSVKEAMRAKEELTKRMKGGKE
jgi:putative ribosome biogenesis GTPase RsgA